MSLGNLEKIGVTASELAKAGNKISITMYEITLEGIQQLAKNRGITFEEAEGIYFKRIRNREINVDGENI